MAQLPFQSTILNIAIRYSKERGYSCALCVFGAQILSMSEETLQNELLPAGKLDCKHRGDVAELAFMRKAATLGFAVAKPWGDCDRYDIVLRAGNAFWRVQIKSVWAVSHSRPHFRVKTTGTRHTPYSADQIDFLVAYIFPKRPLVRVPGGRGGTSQGHLCHARIDDLQVRALPRSLEADGPNQRRNRRTT